MEKKIFDAPYLKVVNVKNDILCSSLPVGGSTNTQYAPTRHGIWDEEFDAEEDIIY